MAVVKRWNGSAWVAASVKQWNGSAWVAATVKHWLTDTWVAPIVVTAPDPSVAKSGLSAQTAGFRLNANGTWDERRGASYTSQGSWITPNGSASNLYEVRITNVNWSQGTAFTSSPVADGSWIDLGSAREWIITDSSSSAAGNKSVTFTVEIRKSGVTLSTGAGSLSAIWDIS